MQLSIDHSVILSPHFANTFSVSCKFTKQNVRQIKRKFKHTNSGITNPRFRNVERFTSKKIR